MAIAGAIAGILGSAVSAFGAIAQANAQAKAAEFNQKVAENQAKFALEAGQVEEQNKRMETNALIGQQRAIQSASGVDINVGSPIDVRVSSQILGELDALTIRTNAQAKAAALRDQATLYGMEADASQLAGWINATSSILSGVSGFASKWNQYQTKSLLV